MSLIVASLVMDGYRLHTILMVDNTLKADHCVKTTLALATHTTANEMLLFLHNHSQAG